MAWIELHQALRTHKKTMKAVSLMKMKMLPEAFVGHLACLWLWCIDNAPNGVLPNDHDMIDMSAGCPVDVLRQRYDCPPDVQSFTEILIKSGFIDAVNDTLILHDWDEYTGKLILQREVDRVRKQEERAQKREELQTKKLSKGRPKDVHRMSEGTQPNPTVPNSNKNAVLLDVDLLEGSQEFYDRYGHKKDPEGFKKQWIATSKVRPPNTVLLPIVDKYKAFCLATGISQKYPAAWLKDRRWTDDNTIPNNGQPIRPKPITSYTGREAQ